MEWVLPAQDSSYSNSQQEIEVLVCHSQSFSLLDRKVVHCRIFLYICAHVQCVCVCVRVCVQKKLVV